MMGMIFVFIYKEENMMIKRRFVTRIAACVLAGIMAMQMTGCGSKKVDYSLDGETSDESGSSDDNGKSTLAKTLGVPDKCDETFDVGKSGLSEIRCTADPIDVPDSEQMKKVYYTTAKLDSERIQSIVEGLLDRSKGIYVRKDGVSTKDELKSMIENTKKFKEEAKSQGDDTSDAWYDSQIESYEKQMAEAPDTLPPLENYDDPYGAYTGKYGDKDYTVAITMYSGNDYVDAGMYMAFSQAETEENKLLDGVSGATYTYVTGVSNATDVDVTNMTNECRITENDAISQAMNFLSGVGIDGMECTDVEPLVRIWAAENGDVKKSEVNGYYVSMSRTINGVPIRSDELYNVDNLQNQNGYMYDTNDIAHVCVNDEGIVYMYTSLYSDSASFKDEDVDILNWNDMISKANESIAAYYEKYQTRYGRIDFNKAELRYVAAVDDSGKKCFIPAWVFTQSEELRGGDTPAEISQIICINAIDGSYIDLVENAKKMKLWQDF